MTAASHHETCGICHTDVCEHTLDDFACRVSLQGESAVSAARKGAAKAPAEVTREHLVAAHDLILALQSNPRTRLEQVDGKDLIAQGLAEFEARGASQASAEVERLRREVARLNAALDVADRDLEEKGR